ncbi:unnamed protein product, partial [Prorocentrum cordatum]
MVALAVEDYMNLWLYWAVQTLGFQSRLGGKHQLLRDDSARRFFGLACFAQAKASRHLARSGCAFLEQHSDEVPNLEWKSELKSSAVGHTGEEVHPAEKLDRERLMIALPPKHADGSVLASEASGGWIRGVLENPEWVLRNPDELGEMPKTLLVWEEGAVWELIAAELVDRRILGPIEEECIVQVRGRRVLGGFFRVRRSGHSMGLGPQRLVMTIIPSNWLQEAIEGDELGWCFYVYPLPEVWHKYMALSKFVSRDVLGLAMAGRVFAAAAAIPMGWISETELSQHIRRRLVREWVAGAELLPVEQGRQKYGYAPSKWANPFKVYIDNLDLLEIADEVALTARQSAGPPEVVHLARAQRGVRGVPRSEGKSVSRVLKSQALGEFVDGELGTFAPPPQKKKDFTYTLACPSLYTLDREKVTQRWLLGLAGRWVRAMVFRREATSAIDYLWRVVARWRGERRLPGCVFREIVITLGLLPLMRRGPRAELRDSFIMGSRPREQLGLGEIRRALDMMGLSVSVHAAVETDAEASREVRRAWPDVRELGDVQLLVGKEVQLFNLIENASSMEATDRQAMSQALGLQPVVIDVADISPARRERLYWWGWDPLSQWQGVADELQEVEGRALGPGPRVCLHQCSQGELARWRTHEYCYAPHQLRAAPCLRWNDGDLVPADPFEQEMLMDCPHGRTATAMATRFRKSCELEVVRCGLLGDSLQCAAVAWILGHWAHCQKNLDDVPSVVQLRQQGGGFDASEGVVRMAAIYDEGVLVGHKVRCGREAQQDICAQMVEEMVRRAEVRGPGVRLHSLEAMRPDMWPRGPISVARSLSVGDGSGVALEK